MHNMTSINQLVANLASNHTVQVLGAMLLAGVVIVWLVNLWGDRKVARRKEAARQAALARRKQSLGLTTKQARHTSGNATTRVEVHIYHHYTKGE